MSDGDINCDCTTTEGKRNFKVSLCCVAALFFLIVLPAVSIVKIAPTETALSYNKIIADLDNEPMDQGLQAISPFGEVIRWPTRYTTVEYLGSSSVRCNSGDGLQIVLDVAFQFVPERSMIYDLTLDFKDFEMYKKLVQLQAKSAIMSVCGDYTAEDFQTARNNVTTDMEEALFSQLEERYLARVEKFQLRNVDRPKTYEDVVKEKENARSDIRLAENQRNQAVTKARTAKQAATQFSQRELNRAAAEANITLSAARNSAAAVEDLFLTRARLFKLAKDEHGLDEAGIINWIANSLFSDNSTVMAVNSASQLSIPEEVEV